MLQILYVRAGQDSRRALLDRMKAGTSPRRVLLVPDQYSHESERAMCAVVGSGASRHCEVLSFTRLARRITDLQGGGAAPVLDAGGRMLLLYAALRQVSDGLKFYKTPSRKPAFLSSLLATVDECCSYQIAPERLVELGMELGGSQGEKWQDIGTICRAYLELCAVSAADPRQSLDRLEEQLKTCRWAEGAECFIHGFADFTPQQEKVIARLAQQGSVTVALVCDPEDNASGLFETAQRTAWRLRRAMSEAGVAVDEETLTGYEVGVDSLRFLDAHLFGPLPQPWQGDCAVERIKCADPRQEVEFAAAEILRLVREEGYRYRDIVLCARKLGQYGELVESVFGRFGIPVFQSNPADVLQKPVLALVTSALAAVAQDYPYEEMFRYLKTDLTGVSRDQRDRLENYVLTWNIRGGTWMREKPWDMHPEGYGLDMKEFHKKQVAELDALRRGIIAPLEKLRRNPDQTGRGRALALYDFLMEIGLEESLEERVQGLEESGKLTEAAQYRQLWDLVVDALEQCALHLEQTELDNEEFSRLFSLTLAQYNVGAIPVSLDRVTAADANRLAFREAKVLFFLGADGNSVPACQPDPGLFSDQDRDALQGFEVELAPRQEWRLRREMTIAYETCCIPSEKLYLSYARAVGNEERTPCFLWERLEKLFPQTSEIIPGESRVAAPAAALELAGRNEDLRNVLREIPLYEPRVERLERAAVWQRGTLSPRGVEALFGETVPMSATRLDLFNSCHFSHFLRFGLDAKPRRAAKFRPTEYGTFVHEVLEVVLGQAKDHGGIAALAENGELRRKLALTAADAYVEHSLSGLEEEPARFRYLFDRMKAAAVAVVDSVVEELALSDFEPARFELGFGRDKELPPVEVENGMTLRLSGFVDRVDQWLHEGKRYLRVVDYKTGKKSFNFSDVEDGRGLQMLLYLFALARSGQQVFGPEEIVPAGVLYIPARNPVVSGERSMTPEDVKRLQGNQLRRQGLVLDDTEVLHAMEHTEGGYRFLPVGEGRGKTDYLVTAEQMEVLDEYVTETLKKAAGEMAAGNIAADPYWHDGMTNACKWCDYRVACHFEECCGDRRRLRKSINGPTFWANRAMGKEAEEHGTETDH